MCTSVVFMTKSTGCCKVTESLKRRPLAPCLHGNSAAARQWLGSSGSEGVSHVLLFVLLMGLLAIKRRHMAVFMALLWNMKPSSLKGLVYIRAISDSCFFFLLQVDRQPLTPYINRTVPGFLLVLYLEYEVNYNDDYNNRLVSLPMRLHTSAFHLLLHYSLLSNLFQNWPWYVVTNRHLWN